MAMNVEYTGLKLLTEDEQGILRKIIEEEYPKLERFSKGMDTLEVDVKTHDKGGKRKLYLLNVKAVAGEKVYAIRATEKDIQKSPYWDIASATHKAMSHLSDELKHKLKEDIEPWRKKDAKKAMKKRGLNE